MELSLENPKSHLKEKETTEEEHEKTSPPSPSFSASPSTPLLSSEASSLSHTASQSIQEVSLQERKDLLEEIRDMPTVKRKKSKKSEETQEEEQREKEEAICFLSSPSSCSSSVSPTRKETETGEMSPSSLRGVHLMLQRSVGNLVYRVMTLLWRDGDGKKKKRAACLPERPRWLTRRLQRGGDASSRGKGRETEEEERETRTRDDERKIHTNDEKGDHKNEEEEEEDVPQEIKEECWKLLLKTRDFCLEADRLMHQSLQIHLYTRRLIQLATHGNVFLDRT
ncbi:methionine trna synthetase, partial [Cystoisospora suis]